MKNKWEAIRKEIRDWRDKKSGYDLRKYWRVLAWHEHAGTPEPIVQAQAFRSVLEHASFFCYPDEKICGCLRSFYTEALPDGLTEATLKTLDEKHKARGQRNFQAGWDHTLPDYPTLLNEGLDGVIMCAKKSLQEHSAPDETTFLQAALITLEAFRDFIRRYAEAARSALDQETADALLATAGPAPKTLRQAMQLVWLTHLALSSEGRSAMALGRMDQYLYPFYQRDMQAGVINRNEVLDLFCHLWVRLDEINQIQNICIGGLTPDGRDGTNELSYILLEATKLVQSPSTNLSARFHDGTPESFFRACFDVIQTGIGFPAIFNDHINIPMLESFGIPTDIARDFCMVGCIEPMLAGRQQAWSDSRFNMPRCLDKALRQFLVGRDLSFEQLNRLFHKVMAEDLAQHVELINKRIAAFPPDRFPDPFLSALTRDCLARARDINDGGAEFRRFHGIAVMGLGTTADSLTAVKTLVIDQQKIAPEVLLSALDADFKGYEPVRQSLLQQAVKYGNDEALVDSIAADVVQWTAEESMNHKTCDGGRFMSCMAANVSNIPSGKEVGATPDGRHAGTPLSDAASPSFGRDQHGPTAFLNSVAAPDYGKVGCTVINMRFDPEHFQDKPGADRFVSMMKFFVKNRIPELQFNFTGTETLLAAQKDPERYSDLLVRVSGFSAHFVNLAKEVQEDVIRRHAHG